MHLHEKAAKWKRGPPSLEPPRATCLNLGQGLRSIELSNWRHYFSSSIWRVLEANEQSTTAHKKKINNINN